MTSMASGANALRVALLPVPAVLLGMISVQIGAVLAKGLFPELGAVATVCLRTGFSAVILLAVFRPPLLRLSAGQWRAAIPYGIALGAMNLVFYLALARIPLGLAVTLEFAGPLAVAVIGSRRAQDFLWVLLAGAGILLITPWAGSQNVDGKGVLFALLAGVGWAAYILLGGRVSRLFEGGEGAAVGMLFALAAVLPFALWTGGLGRLRLGSLAVGVAVALLSSAIPYSLEMVSLRAMPARTFGILMSLEPAIGALSGLVFLRERLSAGQWLAVVLVMTASAGATLTARKAEVMQEL